MKEKRVGRYITDALFELLKTKTLPDITTTEIIQKAGVCRSSFYRNFYLPEDVIRQYGIALFDAIDQRTPSVQKELHGHILSFLSHLWSQRERLSLIESRGLFYLLEDPITEHCRRQIQRSGVQNNRYHVEYHAGAATHVIRAWIRNRFEEPPEEITALICDLLQFELAEK